MSKTKEKQKPRDRESQIQISRAIYDERLFAYRYGHQEPVSSEVEIIRSPLIVLCRNCLPSNCSVNVILSWLRSFFPILEWLPKYSIKENLLCDVTGGITVGIMHIPQGLAFAMLATLPPVTGLYTALIPVLVYMFMGTSRHLSVGSFAVICLMVAQVCEREIEKISFDEVPSPAPTVLSVGNSTWTTPPLQTAASSPWSPRDAKKLEIAVSLSLLIGIMQVVMGAARLGFVAIFLSDPLISGFTTGSAVLVVVSQLKHILGLVVPKIEGYFASLKLLVHLFKNLPSCNPGSIITGVLCFGFLIGLKHANEKFKTKLKFPIPAELLVVILGTSVSYAGDIKENFGVAILGRIPKGLPPLSIPRVDILSNIIPDAFVIAVVIFATNVSLSKMFAKKHGYSIDANQELIAYGMGNIGGAFFSCFAICNALARTVLQENLAKTQICSLMVIVVVLLVLLFIAPLFFYLPKAILAAVVIANLVGLLKQFSRLRQLWKICKPDSVVWFVTCFSVILLGVDKGLVVGLGCAIMAVIVQLSRSRFSVLGQVSDTEIYRDTKELSGALEIPGVKVMRFESSLYFANVERFRNALIVITKVDPIQEMDRNKRVELPNKSNAQSWEQFPLQSTVLVGSPRMSNAESNGVYTNGDVRKTYSKLAVDEDSDVYDDVKSVVIDGSSFTFIDSMGLITLSSVIRDYDKVGIQIYVCACSYAIRKALLEGGFIENVGNERLFVSIHDAVSHVIAQNNHEGHQENGVLYHLPSSKPEREAESRL